MKGGYVVGKHGSDEQMSYSIIPLSYGVITLILMLLLKQVLCGYKITVSCFHGSEVFGTPIIPRFSFSVLQGLCLKLIITVVRLVFSVHVVNTGVT